jgi:carbonic anhydrase/acetyltransferase-like protein (isoleucine patch superfamily)
MTVHAFDGATPQIHPEAFVHPDATIIGNAVVGARSTIWPTTVLRADMNGTIVIGEDTSIQDGAVCHLTEGWSKTVVGDRVTVGHRVILHGCVVEHDCLIGMGSIVLDNARVGAGSLVAAGSVITAGTEIPPGSYVVGSPAKVKGPVSDKHKAMIEGGWRAYVEYGAKYKREMGR